MAIAETVEAPVHYDADGRMYVTRLAAEEDPWVLAFMERCSNYWAYDPLRSCWFGPAPEVTA